MVVSNKPCIFVKNLDMTILGTIDRCLHSIPLDIINGQVVYVELCKADYDLFLLEAEAKLSIFADMSIETKKAVKDIGTCTILSYMGYKIVICINNEKSSDGSFYFAFKTLII